jgi:hypothetical protein
MTTYIKNDTRKIRIEPNPFRTQGNKFKMKTQKLSGGEPVVNMKGEPVFTETTPEALYRVPGTSKRLSPARLPTNALKTGLDHMVLNPYKDLSVYSSEWESILKGKEYALLQHILEYECDYELNFLTHRIPARATASDKDDKKFFESVESKPRLDGGVTFLHMSNPIHRVNYYTLLAHKAVANTYEDLLDGGNLDAEWYIVDEDAKHIREKSKSMRVVEAGAALKELSDSTGAVINMAKALELSEASDRNLKEDRAWNAVYNYYNKSAKNFNEFIELYKLWKDPVSGREKFVAMADLYDYQNQGLVSYKNGKYTWFKTIPGEPTQSFMFTGKMGFVTEFLLDPAQQDNVEFLRDEYENKIR